MHILTVDEAGNKSKQDCEGSNQAAIRFDMAKRNAGPWGTRYIALYDDHGFVLDRWVSPRWIAWVKRLPADRIEAYRETLAEYGHDAYGAVFS